MSNKPYFLGEADAMLRCACAFRGFRRIREINQILRMFVPEIMESNSHVTGSYDTRTFHGQTAMKVQQIASSCTDRASGCI